MTRLRLILPLLLVACSGTKPSSEPNAARTDPNPEVSLVVGVGPVRPELYVAVVDDRPDAAELRATMARSFDRMDAALLADTAICWPPFDPAAFHPIDRSVVVVHPSAAPEARYTSALDVPALSWRTDRRSDAEHAAWSKAVAAALEPKNADAGPFAALDSIRETLELFRGLRSPANDEEAGILGLLPEQGRLTSLYIALGHDDESGGDPASFAVRLGNDVYVGEPILPAAKPPETPGACFDESSGDTPRYAAWLKAQYLPPAGHWPCTDETFFTLFGADCHTERCLDFTPVVDSDGHAHCSVIATLENDEPCNATFGWLDPGGSDGKRAPKFETVNGEKHRLCEIQQLTGSALASCVTSLDCEDCEPGWCATQVPALLACSDRTPYPFRFVGGADRAAWGAARIECEKTR